MKSKHEISSDRAELAARLREIADMVEAGEIRIGDVIAGLADELEYELELEEETDKGKLEIEIEWRR